MQKKQRTKERQHEYDVVYMKIALSLSSLSYAQRRKVGAIIVSKDDQIISQGFNGTPNGYDNCCEDVMEDGSLKTKKIVLHAETNAITKCAKFNTSTKGSTIYITLSPCIDCAKLIVQSDIERVVYLNEYKDTEGLDLLRNCGITVEQIHIDGYSEDNMGHSFQHQSTEIFGSSLLNIFSNRIKRLKSLWKTRL